MSEPLWDAYVRGDYQAIPEDMRRRLDAAEAAVHELFGISPAYYVRANEAPGKSAKLADIIAAVVLLQQPQRLLTADYTDKATLYPGT